MRPTGIQAWFAWVFFVVSLGTMCNRILAQNIPKCTTCTTWVQPGESIQAAIDAAPDGAVICLAEGKWQENLMIERSLTLRGEGKGTSIIDGVRKDYPVVWIRGTTQTISVRIEGLSITGAEGNCAERPICAHGVLIQGSTQTTISDCTIAGNKYNGIWLADSVRVTIQNCTIFGNERDGIELVNSAQATISGSTIFRNRYGITLEDSAQSTISGCTIFTNFDGICLRESAQSTIQDNIIYGNKYDGIMLAGSAQAEIRNNVIQDNGWYGIKSFSNGEVCGAGNRMAGNGVDLAGNLPGTLRAPLRAPTEEEISYPDPRYRSLQEAVDALLPGGRLKLGVGTHMGGVTIAKRLRLEGEQGAKIIPFQAGEAPVLSLVGGADAELVGLEVRGSRRSAGALLLLGANARATVRDITISGRNDYGILLMGWAQATIQNCTIFRSVGGVYLKDLAQATISGCTIFRNWYGIYLGGSARAEIRDNAIQDNTRFGIFSASSGEVRGEGNRMVGNGVDLGGNLPGNLRMPLRKPTEAEVTYPDPRYRSLQEAVDALLPGGRIVLREGEYAAGVTISKRLRLEAGEGAKVVLTATNPDAAPLSLVEGADAELVGLWVTNGGEAGLLLGADSQATITDCTIFGNRDGIELRDSAKANMQNCTISGNRWFGIELEGLAQATVIGCTISGNRDGISLGGSAQAIVIDCTISENKGDGVDLRERSAVRIEAARIVLNRGYGVRANLPGCGGFDPTKRFTGQVTGAGNVIPGPGELNANRLGALCPPYPGVPWPPGFLKE